MELHTTENPWFVENLMEFSYLCCPECDERTKSEKNFLKHALTEHPNSEKGLKKFQTTQVKIEIYDESFDLSHNGTNNDGYNLQTGT